MTTSMLSLAGEKKSITSSADMCFPKFGELGFELDGSISSTPPECLMFGFLHVHEHVVPILHVGLPETEPHGQNHIRREALPLLPCLLPLR